MKVVTAADSKFRPIIAFWMEQVQEVGLTFQIYDLGGLGYGKSIEDCGLLSLFSKLPHFQTFLQHGYYQELGVNSYKSRAVHKPFVIQQAMFELHDQDLLYLDADAFLRGVPTQMKGNWANNRFQETSNWDVCVTVRPTKEQQRTTEEKRSWIGLINAGVIWFNNSEASRSFVNEWGDRTIEEMNDQRALNLMCQTVQVGKVTTIYLRNGAAVRVMGVPTEVYNNYYTEGVDRAAVVHLKQNEWQGKSETELQHRIRYIRTTNSSSVSVSNTSEYYYDDSGLDLTDYLAAYLLYDLLTTDENLPVDENFQLNDVPENQEEVQQDENVQINEQENQPLDDPMPVSDGGS